MACCEKQESNFSYVQQWINELAAQNYSWGHRESAECAQRISICFTIFEWDHAFSYKIVGFNVAEGEHSCYLIIDIQSVAMWACISQYEVLAMAKNTLVNVSRFNKALCEIIVGLSIYYLLSMAFAVMAALAVLYSLR